MSITASRVVRFATLVAAVVLGLTAALATTGATTDSPDAAEPCAGFALSLAGAHGLWEPLLPRDTSPNPDGTCPDGYEVGYVATVCTFAPDGSVVACGSQKVCIPVQQDPEEDASSATGQ